MSDILATDRLRLAAGRITALLGPSVARRRLLAALHDGVARCASGHDTGIRRIRADRRDALPDRLEALRGAHAAVLLVDRVTDGLSTAERHAINAALREVARRGVAVLVDDSDPVAALSVADHAVRVDDQGRLTDEDLDGQRGS